jgi:hypothetical protein
MLRDGISTMIETCNQSPDMRSEDGINEGAPAVPGGFWFDGSWLKIPYFFSYCHDERVSSQHECLSPAFVIVYRIS